MAKAARKFNTETETDVVALDIGRRKRFNLKDLTQIQPKTENQAKALAAMFGDFDMVHMSGSPGSGKSMLAMYAALYQVLDPATPYENVMIIRSAVATRDIGFLPGSLEEKAAVLETPYEGIAKDLMPRFNSPYSHLKSLGYVDFCTTSYIRGTTFHDTILIVDEYQNNNAHELYTILTRLGENSKVFLAGDHKQNDLRKEKSGFSYLEKLATLLPYESCASIQFGVDDVVRSGFAKAVTIADEYIDR